MFLVCWDGYIFYLLPSGTSSPHVPSARTVYQCLAYLPDVYRGTGEYAVALPGGKAVWVELTDGMLLAAVVVWLAGIAALSIWMWRRSREAESLGTAGGTTGPQRFRPEMAPGGPDTAVRLCRGLPTSFVYQGGEKIDGKRYDMIYLQAELSPHRGSWYCAMSGTICECATDG